LPAVVEPSFLKAGFSFANCSGVVARIPSSYNLNPAQKSKNPILSRRINPGKHQKNARRTKTIIPNKNRTESKRKAHLSASQLT
jgi:hypothetical protein